MARIFLSLGSGSVRGDGLAVTLAASNAQAYLVGIGGDQLAPEVEAVLAALEKSAVPFSDSAQLLVDMAIRYPYQLEVVAVGPLTLIAEAVGLEPRLPVLLKRLVVLGGILNPPTVLGQEVSYDLDPTFGADPAAVSTVTAAGFNLEIIPGDLSLRSNAPWTRSELARLCRLQHPVAKLLSSPGSSVSGDLWAGPELALAYFFKPELFSTHPIKISIEPVDSYPRLVEDPTGFSAALVESKSPWKARLFVLEHLKWIDAGMPPPDLNDVQLAWREWREAEPADKERLFQRYLQRVVERVRRRSWRVATAASSLVGGLVSGFDGEPTGQYHRIYGLANELERTLDDGIPRDDPRWRQITDLVDAMFPPELQSLVDHWGIGRITESRGELPLWLLTTGQGTYAVAECGRQYEEMDMPTGKIQEFVSSLLGERKMIEEGGGRVHYQYRFYRLFRVSDQ